MSSRIIIVVYALDDSPKIDYAIRTLNNVLETTDFKKHEFFISDNGSGEVMQDFYKEFIKRFEYQFPANNLMISYNGENLGTSRAFNKGLVGLKEGWFTIKRDDDTIVYDNEWVEKMEDAITRDASIGILGLKRFDLEQDPNHSDPHWRTSVRMLPHVKGQRWLTIEDAEDIIGTCTMFNPELRKRLGGMINPTGLYAWDDVLESLRSKLAGFKNAFLPDIRIDHIDDGSGDFVQWKRSHVDENWAAFSEIADDYKRGVRDLYEPLTEDE